MQSEVRAFVLATLMAGTSLLLDYAIYTQLRLSWCFRGCVIYPGQPDPCGTPISPLH